MEDYAYILDYLAQGTSGGGFSKREPVCYAIGDEEFKLFELVPTEDDLEVGGVRYGDYKENLLRIEPADFSSWPDGTPEHIFGGI